MLLDTIEIDYKSWIVALSVNTLGFLSLKDYV